jgi:hypothetical protein
MDNKRCGPRHRLLRRRRARPRLALQLPVAAAVTTIAGIVMLIVVRYGAG